MENLIDLTGKRILIIGASSGIGKSTAITLSKVGAQLTLVARREDKLQEAIMELNGEGHNYFCGDISDTSSIEILIKKIVTINGPLDGMVYSAGISMYLPLQFFKPEKLQHLFEVNFFGFVECVRQVSKKGRYNDGMRIVAVSSVSSIKGNKTQTGYSASKAAMNAAVRCMGRELAEKGICINSIAPGLTATEMYLSYSSNVGDASNSMKELLSRQYLGVGEPVDIANVIAFLMSPAARFITGVTLPVDGGLTTC